MKHVIVTGGTGVTGNALVRYLLSQNITVTVLVRPNSFRRRYLPEENKKLIVLEAPMDQYPMVSDQLSGVEYDAFFHLAWDGSTGIEKTDNRNNMYLQSRNIIYDINAVELCCKLGCSTFVATGSQAEYGRVEEKISENTPTHPENGYGSAKLCAYNMTRLLCERYGIKHIWARLFSVYGPYDGAHSLIYTSVLKLLRGERPSYTQGEQEWDFLYAYDAAKALVLLTGSGVSGGIYCIANGNISRLKDYIRIIHKTANPEIKPVFGEIPYACDQVMHLSADISKLKAATGFAPDYTFEDGMKEVVEWVKTEMTAWG